MVCIRQATAEDLIQMQKSNMWCLPEKYVKHLEFSRDVTNPWIFAVQLPIEILFVPLVVLAAVAACSGRPQRKHSWVCVSKDGGGCYGATWTHHQFGGIENTPEVRYCH
jgi:hypothetical protein